VVQKLC
jgi:hypothetical protein